MIISVLWGTLIFYTKRGVNEPNSYRALKEINHISVFKDDTGASFTAGLSLH